MIQLNKRNKWIFAFMLSCLLIGCSDNNSGKVQESTYPVVTENEDYQFALPEKEAFKDILQDFIYWEYATMIEKDGESFFSRLDEENCLETELKVHLYYQELDKEEMEEAESYKVKNKFPDGEKERILSAIQESIQEEYKEADNLAVYVRDFLPGNQRLSGEIVNLDIKNSYDMPLYWVDASIFYIGSNMEDFQDICWDTRYSTAYSGASNPDYNPTVKQLKKWAEEEKEAINVEKCILAYYIKDGELIDLKDVDENFQMEK